MNSPVCPVPFRLFAGFSPQAASENHHDPEIRAASPPAVMRMAAHLPVA